MDKLFLLIPVILPFVAGSLTYAIPFRSIKARNIFIFITALINSLFVWALLLFSPSEELLIYRFSDTLNIKFTLDGLGKVFAGMTSLMWPFATLYAFEYMEHEKHTRMFFAFYLFTFGITEAICFSGNLITLFVFYEMLTLVTLPLVLSRFDEDSMFASRRYAIYCLGGSAFAFIGVVFLSVYGGGSDFILGGIIGDNADRTVMLAVYLVSFFGFGVKAAVFPLSGWLPLASVAPTPVTALLHAVAVVKSGVFAIMRLSYYCYGSEYLHGSWAQQIATAAAILTCVYGACMALRERHFKRRLAYSTVSNLSYILFGVSLATTAGFAAGLTHMVFHGIIKFTAFMCAGAFMHKTGKEYLFELDGIGRKMPVTFACFTVSALSLVGIPTFCGFISKIRLIFAALDDGTFLSYLGAGGLIISAFLCAIYMFSVVVRAYFPRNNRDLYVNANVSDPSARMLVPLCLFSVLNVIFGLFPSTLCGFIDKVANGLL